MNEHLDRRHRPARRRDGHVRAGRDPGPVRLGAPADRRDHGDRPDAPGADRLRSTASSPPSPRSSSGPPRVCSWVDEPRLAALADRATIRIWRCGTHGSPALAGHTDVVSVEAEAETEADSDRWLVRHDGAEVGWIRATSVHPGNVACAVAAALAAGVPESALAERLARLEPPPHRATAGSTDTGLYVIDDTYNANPAGPPPPSTAWRAPSPAVVWSSPPASSSSAPSSGPPTCASASRWPRAAPCSSPSAARTAPPSSTAPARRAARCWPSTAARLRVTGSAANLGDGDGVLWENDLPDTYPETPAQAAPRRYLDRRDFDSRGVRRPQPRARHQHPHRSAGGAAAGQRRRGPRLPLLDQDRRLAARAGRAGGDRLHPARHRRRDAGRVVRARRIQREGPAAGQAARDRRRAQLLPRWAGRGRHADRSAPARRHAGERSAPGGLRARRWTSCPPRPRPPRSGCRR